MEHRSPILRTLDELPSRVLCVATRVEDLVLGCGGMLAAHARRKDRVHALVLCALDGDEDGSRTAQVARGLADDLGIGEVECLGLAPGSLSGCFELVEHVKARLLVDDPELVYVPAPLEPAADHRAASHATAAALTAKPSARVLVYSVRASAPVTALFDVAPLAGLKADAINGMKVAAGGAAIDVSHALDRVRGLAAESGGVELAESFTDLRGDELLDFCRRSARSLDSVFERPAVGRRDREVGLPEATAVISTWNKCDDLRANLAGLRAQTLPFTSIVVVDNASTDRTAAMVTEEFPEVRLIVMPHSAYGACETFNIGFASSQTELTAILDDDVVLPPGWLEGATRRLVQEPSTTAIVSTKIVEPGMPEAYKSSPAINRERYMSTFRGCASLARTRALAEAGGYDERLFIYGNERDLTCRILNLGYRVLQYPGVEAAHKTPFGIKMGKRSLYYHARNAWLTQLKYAPWGDLLRMPWLVISNVLLRSSARETTGEISDATGTIGIARSIRETPGAWLVLLKAAASVACNVPYCLKRRKAVTAPDFELPIR